MILKLLLLLLLTLKTSRCSLVIDKPYQAGIKLSDYCPKMEFCPEGAHTMCMNYNPKKKMGPQCFNAQKVTMVASLASTLIETVNVIRSKIANGNETGKGGVSFPRGYGIFRLKWDSELATFAQLWADQCIFYQDLCRATKRFKHPSQSIIVLYFTYPNWATLKANDSKGTGFKFKLQEITMTVALARWYSEKNNVNNNMLKSCPDWSIEAYNNQSGRSYIELINGDATHMGCGISAYSEYKFLDNVHQGVQNGIEVVCNFSSGARKGTEVYKTIKPAGKGFSARCGCPPGSREDSDCLCNEAPPVPPKPPTCPLGVTSSYCDTALVLLPIFSFEDAPPEKLIKLSEEKDPFKGFVLQRKEVPSKAIVRRSRFKPKARARKSQELMKFIREKAIEDVFSRPQANKPSSEDISAPSLNKEQQSSPQFRLAQDLKPPPLPPPPPRRPPALRLSPLARPHSRLHLRPHLPPPLGRPPPRIPPPPPPPRVEPYSTALQIHVKPRPSKPASRNRKSRPPPKLPPKNHQMKKKASIIKRVAHFQLPGRRSSSPFKVLKKDVEPRKDFSNLNQIVNDYQKRHPGYRIINGNNEQTQPTKYIKPHTGEKATTEAVAIETGLNRAEETVMNFNQYLGKKNSSNYNDKDVDIKDDYDKKLLSLLDTLEREVKHIALDGDEKQLFHAKIRKIYGTIAGKTALQMFPKPILFSASGPEAAEIDFGETKSRDQFEPNQVENVERVKHISQSVQGHKWKNKFIDSFDQKIFNPDVSNNGDWKSSDRYDQKYNDNHFENTYGDIQHQRMDELDHKHNENLNTRYNENLLDQGYNEVPPNFDVNVDPPHHYDLDRKYNDDEPAARRQMKYQADRAVLREFQHNSLESQEDIAPRNYRNIRSNEGPPDIPLITKDKDERKIINKKRAKSLGSRNEGDVLSLERRQYYQEKLDKIKRKLRGQRNGRKTDPKNELKLRRMIMINRQTSGMRSKDQADQFYMPEGATFLLGF